MDTIMKLKWWILSTLIVVLISVFAVIQTVNQPVQTARKSSVYSITPKESARITDMLRRSIKDCGTTILIRIPVNNMVINGIVVEIGNKRLIIPTPYISEIFEKNSVSYVKVMDKNRYLKIRNEIFEIIDSKEILGIEEVPENVLILLESFGIKKVITVNKIIGRRDISVTNLNIELSDKLPFIGATILGDGKVYLILDIDYILNFKYH